MFAPTFRGFNFFAKSKAVSEQQQVMKGCRAKIPSSDATNPDEVPL